MLQPARASSGAGSQGQEPCWEGFDTSATKGAIVMKGVIVLLAVGSLAVDLERQFAEWKVTYGRKYTGEEDAKRFANFRRNAYQVSLLNAADAHIPEGAIFKLNKYADWDASELGRLRGVKGLRAEHKNASLVGPTPKIEAPASYDWRTKGVLPDIQDQGQCGSCWAFSATAALEAQAAIKSGGSPQKLAEQFLVDCDHQCGQYRQFDGCDAGCNGGLMPSAWIYTKAAGGQPAEADYPYTARDGTCKSGLRPVTKPNSWEFAAEDESQIASYVVANGPVSIAVDARNWSFYHSGVMSSTSVCP